MTTGISILLHLALFLAILLMMELGYLLARRRALVSATATSVGGVTGAVASLMGLVLAFSFSNAATRLERQRQLAIEEGTAIETSWSRISLMEPADQEALRPLYRQYLDARLQAHEALPRMREYDLELTRGEGIQRQMWERTVGIVRAEPELGNLVIPAFNVMVAAADNRKIAVRTHISELAMGFMVGLVLLGSLLIGTSAADKGRIWSYRILFAAVISSAVLVIIDLDFPYSGIVGTRVSDELLLQLRRSMGH